MFIEPNDETGMRLDLVRQAFDLRRQRQGSSYKKLCTILLFYA